MSFDNLLKLARRITFVLSGDAIQSGLHFVISIALLKLMSARDYGIFTLTMVCGGVGISYMRSLASMPGTIFIARNRGSRAARQFEGAFNALAIVVCVVITLAVAILLGAWSPSAALPGSIFVGLWCARFHLRTIQFAYERRWIAISGDYAFAASGTVLAGLGLWRGNDLLRDACVALALANLVGVVVIQALTREAPVINLGYRARKLLRALLGRLGWSAVKTTMYNLYGQSVALLVVRAAGPQGYAPIAAIVTLFSPLRMVATSMENLVQPEIAAKLAQGESSQALNLAKIWTVMFGILSLVYGLIALAMANRLDFASLHGQPVYLLVALGWAICGLSALSSAPRGVIEALLRFRFGAAITTVAAVIVLVSTELLLRFAPSGWALAGSVLSEIWVLVSTWVFVWRTLGNDQADRQTAWRADAS